MEPTMMAHPAPSVDRIVAKLAVEVEDAMRRVIHGLSDDEVEALRAACTCESPTCSLPHVYRVPPTELARRIGARV